MHFQKHDAWYALFVNNNQEEKVKAILEKKMGEGYLFIVPTRELRERKSGKWQVIRRKLCPGYILMKANMNIDVYYKLKKIPGIIKLLRDDNEILAVDEREIRTLNMLLGNEGNNIGISKLYKENDEIRIIAGPLSGMEGQIRKIDFRKGRAKLNLSFMNEERIVELGFELVEKI